MYCWILFNPTPVSWDYTRIDQGYTGTDRGYTWENRGHTRENRANRLQTRATPWHILDTPRWHRVRPCDTLATSVWSGVQTVATPAIPPYIWDWTLQMSQIFTDNPGAQGHFHRGTPWPEAGQWDLFSQELCNLILHTVKIRYTCVI